MGKIIRDRVPETLHPHYPDMQTRLVSDLQEHILLLVQKIIEEYSEFSSACNMPQKREEAADVFEVLDTLFHL